MAGDLKTNLNLAQMAVSHVRQKVKLVANWDEPWPGSAESIGDAALNRGLDVDQARALSERAFDAADRCVYHGLRQEPDWQRINGQMGGVGSLEDIKSTAKQPARNQAISRVSSSLALRTTKTRSRDKEVRTMPHLWPEDTDFAYWELDVLDRDCPVCGRRMYICDHRSRHFYTLEGPVELVCRLNHCPDPNCPGHGKTKSPEVEPTIALPGWGIAWDVFCWIGHRRFARHWSIPQIRTELLDTFAIHLTEPGIARYLQRYQAMLAARQQDPQALDQHYRKTDSLILSIDGLQPEKGHETLYVVRELTGKRVWFAEALLSATAGEVRRLIAQAKQWAAALDKTVRLWISDKQDAFVTGIAAEFPGVPHQYCANHFLRDLAKPVLEADSHAKVQMRKKVRGLRGIEQAVLKRRKTEVATCGVGDHPEAAARVGVGLAELPPAEVDPVGAVVLDYTAAVRGILNDDQGGPLHPPGVRMAEALREVRESIQRNLGRKKGASRRSN